MVRLVRGAVTTTGEPDCFPWRFWLEDVDLLASTAPRGLPDGLVIVPASPAPFQASGSSVPLISLFAASMMACAIVKIGEMVVRLDFRFFFRTSSVAGLFREAPSPPLLWFEYNYIPTDFSFVLI